jgi:2,3-bisphosphoglycerate-independent phosphoglycerate mutase
VYSQKDTIMNPKRAVLLVVMDGVGEREARFGNACQWAHTPTLDYLRASAPWTLLKAHGQAVGHNAIGAGRIFDQGAKLVEASLATGHMFQGSTWKTLCGQVGGQHTLHFLGLLSDGNVHSHERHLHAMLRQAAAEGIRRIRVHGLFDGRDVPEGSSVGYVKKLEAVLEQLRTKGCDARMASGGGRMRLTMDRYQADWAMVERGWRVHVRGEGPQYASMAEVFAANPHGGDQFFPEFVIAEGGRPVGPVEDGDGVVFFNFRGDRAIEISQAFTAEEFPYFDRGPVPQVFFAGMMQYDGDLKIPTHYLVEPPSIQNSLGEHLAGLGIPQFACSETQKFGHVTYFFNGNRSGAFDPKTETYVEIPSDNLVFNLKPWMKAHEITEVTLEQMKKGSFGFGRINYPNGDMVGHTGDFDAAILAVETVDRMLERLILMARKTGTVLMITADHGNCEAMFQAESGESGEVSRLWGKRPAAKTSHTTAPVPFYLYDPLGGTYRLREGGGLSHIANTVLEVMGLPTQGLYDGSLIV